MSKLRIYIAIATFDPLVGGAEVQAKAQGVALRERGHEATVVTFRHLKEWPSRAVVSGLPVIRVAGKLLVGRKKYPKPIQKLLYLLAQVTIAWTLWTQRHQYDVLHVYQLSLLALPTALVSRLARKPMIISVRSTGKMTRSSGKITLAAGPLDPTEPCLQVDGHNWSDGDLEALERTGKFLVDLTRSLLLRTRAVVIALSTRMKDYLAAHDFLLPTMQLIPNGVDINRFHPMYDEAAPNTRESVVVCVAKFRYEKGIDVLLQAWYIVQKEFPQARLILVGIGSLQQQLQRMAEALQIIESIEFMGLQSDVPAQLHRAAIAVLPSRWEGMPNAVLEAMACGLPCVATRVSGSEDIIQHGQNGLLVEPEDYEAMAQALLALLRDPVLARRYGQAARERIKQYYSFEHITDTYIELYQTVLGRREEIAANTPSSETYSLPL